MAIVEQPLVGASVNIVELPLVDYDAPVKLALKRLQESSRSALVTKGELTILIIMLNEVLFGIRNDIETVAQLPTKTRVQTVTEQTARVFGLNVHAPHETEAQFESFLDIAGTDFGILPVAGPEGSMLVVTRHEGQTAQVGGSPTVCSCSKSSNHVYGGKTVSHGDPCPTGDGGKMYCR